MRVRVPGRRLQRRYAITPGAEVTTYSLGRIDGALGIKLSYTKLHWTYPKRASRVEYLRGIADAEWIIEWNRLMDGLALPASKNADPVQPDLDFGGS